MKGKVLDMFETVSFQCNMTDCKNDKYYLVLKMSRQ